MSELEIDATYSAEDNKLRLRASERLEPELYARVKEQGFRWAPKQDLFVAPSWSPSREDFCLELAGSITAEHTTLVERAEAKAVRLDNLAAKRADDADTFRRAADRLAARFDAGQPILVGHHSERRARRDKDKMDNAMHKSIDAANAVDYWQYRAGGVERHANCKADAGVRIRRMKKLLAELRDTQRDINHAYKCLSLWQEISAETEQERYNELVDYYVNAPLKTGSACPWTYSDALRDGTMTRQQVVSGSIDNSEKVISSPRIARRIQHLLNRLAYERSELGPVGRFDGDLTATILQAFAREHGADSPKAEKDGEGWCVSSAVPLPLHIAEGKWLALHNATWRDLMASVGYEVPAKKAAKPPILNFKASYITGHSWGNLKTFRQVSLTKAQYSAIYSDHRGVKLSECGAFRFKICKNPEQSGWNAEWIAVYLSDSKAHGAPESPAISYEAQEETA